jgi:hypothetical protein
MDKDQVMIHVRFAPNGTVTEIGERPSAMTAQQWFNLLTSSSIDCYESLSGGRGLFRMPRAEVDQLKTAA